MDLSDSEEEDFHSNQSFEVDYFQNICFENNIEYIKEHTIITRK